MCVCPTDCLIFMKQILMENKKKKIALLGSTGSIGTQALEVIREHADLYEAYVLTANNNADLLIRQAREFRPETVVVANEAKYAQVQEALSGGA